MSAEELKSLGNDAFAKGNYTDAEDLYKQAIKIDSNSHVLYSNLAAAYLQQDKLEDALEAANAAIAINSSWMKAYFRKATAYEKMGKLRECYLAWNDAMKSCEKGSWLKAQFEKSKANWKKVFLLESVDSTSDLLERFTLLSDSRERLSTLAHFWNASSQEERLQYYHVLLSIIGGTGEFSDDVKSVSATMMLPMPLHNYEDLPAVRIKAWCDFFDACSLDEKSQVLTGIWEKLSSKEQDAVVQDLKLFIEHSKGLVHASALPMEPSDI